MAFPASLPRRLRFGEFELDARSGELRNNGRRVTLAEQPLQVLLALVERSGELVTRDELRQRLWPEQTFVDFDHGLNAAVKRLRDALSDSADSPRYIETLPRRGYRFVAPVENDGLVGTVEPTAASRDAPDAVSSDVGRTTSGRRRTAVLVVGLLALMAAAGWWIASRDRGESRSADGPVPVHRELTRLTFDPGLQTQPTWSPDGHRIAYASDKSGNFDIWVQAVDGGPATQLTSGPEADTQPAWSPDGERIAFRSERDGGGLFVMPARGGAARKLSSFGEWPSWTADGAEVRFPSGVENVGPFVVPADGGMPPRAVLAESVEPARWVWFAPHPAGRLFAAGYDPTGGFRFFTMAADGTDERVVSPPPSMASAFGFDDVHPHVRFHWNSSGTTMFLEVVSNEVPSIWRVPGTAHSLDWRGAEQLTSGPSGGLAAAVSPDGQRLAFSSVRSVSRAWIYPFDPAAGRILGAGQAVTDDDTSVVYASLSSDGERVIYGARRAGRDVTDVYQVEVASGESQVIVRNTSHATLSTDGARAAYLLFRPGSDTGGAEPTDVLEFAPAIIDIGGDERLLRGWSSASVFHPSSWASDDSAILGSYRPHSHTSPAVLAVWPITRPMVENAPEIILQAPGHYFWQGQYSPKDRWITFVVVREDRPGRLEMGITSSASPSSKPWTRIASDHQWPDKPRWAPDGRSLYFLSPTPAGYLNLWAVRMNFEDGSPTGEPFRITDFSSPSLMIGRHPSTDEMDVAGESLLLTMRSDTGNIWMLSDVDK